MHNLKRDLLTEVLAFAHQVCIHWWFSFYSPAIPSLNFQCQSSPDVEEKIVDYLKQHFHCEYLHFVESPIFSIVIHSLLNTKGKKIINTEKITEVDNTISESASHGIPSAPRPSLYNMRRFTPVLRSFQRSGFSLMEALKARKREDLERLCRLTTCENLNAAIVPAF